MTGNLSSPVISELLQLLLTAGESVVGGSVFEPWLLSFDPGQELFIGSGSIGDEGVGDEVVGEYVMLIGRKVEWVIRSGCSGAG